MDRRRLVTALIVVAIAVPLVVEGMTLLGLVGQYVGGKPAPTPTPTPDAGSGGVDVGEDLLAETDRVERLTTATLQSGERWTLTITVEVHNTGEVPYEVRLTGVVTKDGQRVEGSSTTGTVPPNGTATVSHQWSLPSGSLPGRLAVATVEYRDGDPVTVVDREVNLAYIPVQG